MADPSSSDHLIAMRDGGIDHTPVEVVPTRTLTASFSPRTSAQDATYARQLADLSTPLPPIVVHRATRKVVDGVHRLAAARLTGTPLIAVRFFDGTAEDAALLAVALNTTHGRPLSLAERTAAAERILALHPQWSDRAVAAVAGLSPSKVAQTRRQTQQGTACPDARIGRDGRVRPLSTTEGRRYAGELLKANPGASLRQIAALTGISAATVADVRNRMARGASPVPSGARKPTPAEAATPARAPSPAPRAPRRTPPPALVSLSQVLRKDPSLRFNDAGRSVLRMLDACTLVDRERQQIMARIPSHCKEMMSQLMYGYAEICRSIAQELQETTDASRRIG